MFVTIFLSGVTHEQKICAQISSALTGVVSSKAPSVATASNSTSTREVQVYLHRVCSRRRGRYTNTKYRRPPRGQCPGSLSWLHNITGSTHAAWLDRHSVAFWQCLQCIQERYRNPQFDCGVARATHLAVDIHRNYLDSSNSSWSILPDYLVTSPTFDDGFSALYGNITLDNDLAFFWDNEPTFSSSVVRLNTGDILLSTTGGKIVYEDQLNEFTSRLPDHYNLYGLGETIHGLRLGSNFTKVCCSSSRVA
jgi:hypothetical protein